MTQQLRRTLGVFDAVVVGLGAMLGAGVFVALGPAAGAAGTGLLWGLAVAALVAYCNAMSSARLAVDYPASGGTYVYGRERLGAFWGWLAGWAFVVGKTASCAAMALTVGAYVWPGQAHAVAVAAVVVLTAVNYGGVRKSATLTRVIVAVVLAVLAAVVVVSLGSDAAEAGRLGLGLGTEADPEAGSGAGSVSAHGVLGAAGLLFFAFAGYARITTLGEEVRDPAVTIPRAVPLALGLVLAVYACVAVAALSVLGADGLGRSAVPLADAVRAAGASWLVPVVRVGAAVGALGALLALILGISRTTLAMARDGHLPRALAAVHPGSRCRTGPSWRWAGSWPCWRRRWTCAGRSASRRSGCWRTTRSPTRRRGRSVRGWCGYGQRSGSWAVSCWPSRCPVRRSCQGPRCCCWERPGTASGAAEVTSPRTPRPYGRCRGRRAAARRGSA